MPHLNGRTSAESSRVSNKRLVPPPINIPTRHHKSVTIDDFEKGLGPKKITTLDYYEEIRKRPIKILMTREISQYYGRETYLKTTIKEILTFSIFLIILSILIWRTPTKEMHKFTASMANLFIEKEFIFHGTQTYMNFDDICRIEHIWVYMDHMISTFKDKEFFHVRGMEMEENKDSTRNFNQLMGRPRLRTVRVKNDSCEVAKEFKNSFAACFGYFSSSNEYTRPIGSKEERGTTTWNYMTEEETGMHVVYGTVSSYNGGGFYYDCPKKSNDKFLKELKTKNWIDRSTRAVIIDFTAFNANINLFCIVKLLFEIPPSGGVIPSSIIHTLKLIDYGSKNVELLLLVIMFIFFFVFYTIEELYEMTYFKREFIKSFWNLLDVCIVMMSYLVIITNLYQYVTANAHLVSVENNDSKFVNFDQMLYTQVICNNSLALLVFLSWLKVMKFVGINHSMFQLQATFQLACKDIIWYTVIFVSVLLTFAFSMNNLFGSQIQNYCTLSSVVWTLVRAVLGDSNLSELDQAQPILGPLIFFLSIFIIFYIFGAVYVAMLLDRYAEVRSEISMAPAQMKIRDVFKNWFVDILKTFSLPLANRAREKFNKRKRLNDFQDVQNLLLRCGFTELEINMFLAKYEISNDREFAEADLQHAMAGFQEQGTPTLGLARQMVCQSIAEKLTALEVAIDSAVKKIFIVMSILEIIEAKVDGNN